ncbi:hypothetical protein [Xanthomonas euroxanthea]|uniref:hypothetical protein n=1 Tax=Xanthomonas euroxanthea TaxID=2259622 RepID=UPI00141BD74D|nr:hypothetical protein [Xanthomonas euroxanthea]
MSPSIEAEQQQALNKAISNSSAFQSKTGFDPATDQRSGAVSSSIAGPCGGIDAATEPHGWIHGVSRER